MGDPAHPRATSPRARPSPLAALGFKPSGFFAMRTPLLPANALVDFSESLRAPRAFEDGGDLEAAIASDRAALTSRLRALVASAEIREALFVASPSLDAAIVAWLEDPKHARAHGVEDILVRYFARMASRPTPFGLFSGCSVGAIAGETNLAVAPRSAYRRHTRLDTQYLAALCDALHADPKLRASLRYKPSSGLYASATHLRYAEGRNDAATRARSYHLVSVTRTDYLDATLARAHANGGALPSEIATALVEHDAEVTREEADAYIEQLIESQILVSDLAPPITGKEPLAAIVETLRSAGASDANDRESARAVLTEVTREIATMDEAGLGLAPARYRAIAERLAALPEKPDIARLFQVDLYKPSQGATFGGAALREVESTIELFTRIGAQPPHRALDRFREAFRERYEDRVVPLVVALDEESGIGFSADMSGSADPSPLIDGLPFPRSNASPEVTFGAREHHLLAGLSRCLRDRKTEWALDDEEVRALASPKPATLPDVFAAMATIASESNDAFARGDFRVYVHSIGGPSGASLLGRFCHGDPELRRHVEAHLRAEEARRPNAIFAEVIHLSDGRLGNILCRPALRAHEIVYLARAGVDEEHQIAITDLHIAVSGNRIVLTSKKLGCEIVPRLTSAHNFSAASLGVYGFLCSLQTEGSGRSVGWSWGPLASAPFLPRVSRGRAVLSLAQWTVSKAELAPLVKSAGAERFRAARALRAKHGLPRWVSLADRDNVLPIDFDNALHLDSFAQLVKSRAAITLVESFATHDGLIAAGSEGCFTHEIVVPFERAANPGRSSPNLVRGEGRRAISVGSVTRTLLPGGNWLYAKLYAGSAGVDAILKEAISPLVASLREAGAIEQWFFIRYNDPHWHRGIL